MEEIYNTSIDQQSYPRGYNTGFHPIDKFRGEAKSEHYMKKEIMPNSIKSVIQI